MTQVRCVVKGVFVTTSDTVTVPVMMLADGKDCLLSIYIAIWEAVSIESAQVKEVLPQPFTHDLFTDLGEKFSFMLRYLQIDSIGDGVYYAQLVMSSG